MYFQCSPLPFVTFTRVAIFLNTKNLQDISHHPQLELIFIHSDKHLSISTHDNSRGSAPPQTCG